MSEGFNLPKQVASGMVWSTFKGDTTKIKTDMGDLYKGKTLQDQSIDAICEFTNTNSRALKRMSIAWIKAVDEKCY